MAEFVLDYSGVKGSLDEMKNAYTKMYTYSDAIEQVSRALNGAIDSSVITTVKKAASNNDEIAKDLEKLRSVLKDILGEYNTAEKAIYNSSIDVNKISDPASTDTFWEATGEYLKDAALQVVLGSYYDESNVLGTLAAIAVETALGAVPKVGCVLALIPDTRDLVKAIQDLFTDGAEPKEYVNLVLAGTGYIKGVGEFCKHGDEVVDGAIKLGKKIYKNIDMDDIADATKGVLKKGGEVYQILDKKIANATDEIIGSKLKKLKERLDLEIKAQSKNATNVINIMSSKVGITIKDEKKFAENLEEFIKETIKSPINSVRDLLGNGTIDLFEDRKDMIGEGTSTSPQNVEPAY